MSCQVFKRAQWSLQHSSHVFFSKSYRLSVDDSRLHTRMYERRSRSASYVFDTANYLLRRPQDLWMTNREPCPEALWSQGYGRNGATTTTLGGRYGWNRILDECMLMVCRAACSWLALSAEIIDVVCKIVRQIRK